MTPDWCQRLNLKRDKLPSNIAFNCNLRHYNMAGVEARELEAAADDGADDRHA